ncbi:hypothetical protein [Micromonospora sp. NPDC005806]|uniref:hypothetical protein n=1 Tax=Micromonospora sp. NPDC005806 TaxID=3364234 RepID=UPI0036CBA8E0
MGQTHRGAVTGVALLALLPIALTGCGFGAKDDAGGAAATEAQRAPAEEAAAKSRERVQAYLDAIAGKDVDAGRSQLCAPMQASFDAAATGPNGDFADHFTVPQATITDVRSGPHGEEVSTSITVVVGSRKATRSLLFTVTRGGADWCISGEAPGGNTPEPTTTP